MVRYIQFSEFNSDHQGSIEKFVGSRVVRYLKPKHILFSVFIEMQEIHMYVLQVWSNWSDRMSYWYQEWTGLSSNQRSIYRPRIHGNILLCGFIFGMVSAIFSPHGPN